MFSGGKDSITLVYLAIKAFAPAPIPFPLVHIDTGHNFKEALDYRDECKNLMPKLIVRKVEDTIKAKTHPSQKESLHPATGYRLIPYGYHRGV